METLLIQQHPNDVDEITEAEVDEAIAAKRRNSAPGDDGINFQVLKHLPANAVLFLTAIFNSCLRLGFFPSQWKRAEIIMILKPGKNSNKTSSYRPISLLNTMGKLLERVLADRIKQFCAEKNIIPAFQYGFRQHHSVQDAVLRLCTDITQAINNKEIVAAIFLDIERAFDSVWHNGLLFKLWNIKIPYTLLKIIAAFLSQRAACVRINGFKSRKIICHAGTPQGSILSPLLFLLFCSDIPGPVSRRSAVQQFADDTACWARSLSPEIAVQELQEQLHQLESWMRRWRVKPNPSKSQLIIFRNRYCRAQRNLQFQVQLWNTAVQAVRQTVYLGFQLTQTLYWKPDINRCAAMMRQRSGLIATLRGNYRGCSTRIQKLTYKMFVRPLADFRAVIYAAARQPLLQNLYSLERRFLRRIHGLKWDSPSADIHRTAAFQPMRDRFRQLQSRFVQRCIRGVSASGPLLHQPLTTSRRKPKYKYPDTIISLLQNTDELPQDLLDKVDETPLHLRA